MAGRTDGSLTTIEVDDTEQVGGSGRHVEEDGTAGDTRGNSRTKRETLRSWRL
ncbi:hypothetical protein JI435_413160 [Parastagonospora nodorum SN15]|uniref:Uncharacterized protein n=1 Tax=Phaeosphaeria nodorum (strain SN15 / ATCC MYA-4574 / FGSC 10173) TaxID=321614 RepID=A0A7U2F5Q4_PHANO|nr:hypothetical protein JI435_413160 [Parastagonospora nodorum SN15]